MKYTKEQLQAMSDFDVNKALAIAKGKYAGDVGDWMPNGVKVNDESGFFYTEMNYCNTPNDIMPLAFEHKLTLMPAVIIDDWGWQALKNNMLGVSHYYSDKNPLRAIACCLILVLQGEKE